MTTTPKPEPASVMTPNEARECLDRYNTSHWNKDGRRARYSIPASPMDDDIRMATFIDQAEADRARIRELEERITILQNHKCENCGSFTVSVFAEPEPGR